MRFLELKIPPPLVLLLVAAGMWAAAEYTPRLEVPWVPRLIAALAFALAGIAIAVAGLVQFRRAGTTIDPMRAERASSLVRTGVYAFTRNPMYLGVLLLLLGVAVYLAAPAALLGPLLFCLYITRFQIIPEERILTRLFGQDFLDYRSKVRRWL